MYRSQIAQIGFALQSGLGVPASNPTYAMGLRSGLPEPSQELEVVKPAAHRLVTQTAQKLVGTWKGATEVWAHPASVGVLIKAMLVTENVSGAGPYDHAFTPGATDRYLTLFSRRPGDLYERFSDGLIETLIFAYEASQRVGVTASTTGLAPEVLASPYTPGSIEGDTAADSVFVYVGGTLKMDWVTTPATTAVLMEGGALRLTRPLTVVPTADDLDALALLRGPLEIEVEARVIVDSWAGYRSTFFGSTSGSTPSPTVPLGSIDLTFQSATTPTHTLQVEVPNVFLAWDPPQPARGGALVVEIKGTGVRPSSGDAVTLTVTNALSGTY